MVRARGARSISRCLWQLSDDDRVANAVRRRGVAVGVPLTPPAVTVDQVAASVTVTPLGAAVSGLGSSSTYDFDAQAFDSNGNPVGGATYVWSTLNSDVAVIDGNGVATPARDGQVTIQAQADGAVGYAVLTVSDPDASPVNLWSAMASGTADTLGCEMYEPCR